MYVRRALAVVCVGDAVVVVCGRSWVGEGGFVREELRV